MFNLNRNSGNNDKNKAIEMDIGAVLIKLKPDTHEQVKSWQEQLEARKSEAIETLKAEGVMIESWFHVELEGENYLIAYMRAENIAHAQEVGRKSQFAIDQVHKAFKQTWEKVYPAKLLLDLENEAFKEK